MAGSKISRKQFLVSGAAGLGALAAPHVARAQSGGGRPNILFIVLDQLRSWQDFPSDLPLPGHQRLLSEGRGFTQYQVNQAPCGPSRSVIYTGQHVQKTGVYTNSPSETSYPPASPPAVPPIELPTSMPTIGTMLRSAGYYTAYKGKWHLSPLTWEAWRQGGGQNFPNTRDLLEPYGFSDYNHYGEDVGLQWMGFGKDGEIAGEAATLMYDFVERDRTGGKPWFLAVNLVNPHDIMWYDPFGTADQPYDISEEPRPPGSREAPAVPPYDVDWGKPMPRSFYEDDLSTKPSVQSRAGRIPHDDEATWRGYQNYYFNCARDGDIHVVTLLEALDRFGLADNTIVVMTGDHGEMGGAHGMIGKGAEIYKESIRVPLIVRHPDVRGGTTTDALAGAVDLAPTLLGLAGMDAGARAERFPDLVGVDVSAPIADASARTERDQRGHLYDYVTAAVTAEGPSPRATSRGLIRGVHDGRYKFARYFAAGEHHIPRDWETLIAHNDLELYDLAADPDEIVNLAHEPESHRELIMSLNDKVNALIDREVGKDDGSIYPGPTEAYDLKA